MNLSSWPSPEARYAGRMSRIADAAVRTLSSRSCGNPLLVSESSVCKALSMPSALISRRTSKLASCHPIEALRDIGENEKLTQHHLQEGHENLLPETHPSPLDESVQGYKSSWVGAKKHRRGQDRGHERHPGYESDQVQDQEPDEKRGGHVS